MGAETKNMRPRLPLTKATIPITKAPLAAVAFAALLAGSMPATARAQNTDSHAWAQTLFDEGRQLRKAGKMGEACEKFAASQKLDPAVGTLLNIAECSERLERLATAWASYKEAAALARVKNDRLREARANDSAAKLEASLSRLTIRVASPATGTVVQRGDDPIPSTAWNVALPIDGGTYTIRATAPERAPYTTTVNVPASRGAIVVDIPALEAAPAAGAPATPPTYAAPSTASTTPLTRGNESQTRAPEIPAPARPNRIAPLVAFGIGIVGAGIGGFFGLRARDRWDEAQSGGCSEDGRCIDAASATLAENARADGDVATVAFLVAGAAAATGAVLWILGGPSTTTTARVGATPGGLVLGGSFR